MTPHATRTQAQPPAGKGPRERLAVIDADTHCGYPSPGLLSEYLPSRWRRWLEQVGLRSNGAIYTIPRQRQFAHRLDSVPPTGGMPGTDPEFAREQLLDEYAMSGALLNLPPSGVGGNEPSDFGVAMTRAHNDVVQNHWFTSDPRWFGSIQVTVDQPAAAVAEIVRCAEGHDHWRQVMLSTRNDYPIGNPRYWPVIEAAVHYHLPLAFHLGGNRLSQLTACGLPTYYFEDHTGFGHARYSLLSSLIFEGVFDRFPTLQIVLVELGWSWVAPFAWRMDAAWRVLREEVPDLERKPSEYVRDQFWLTTQPAEEPEQLEWLDGVYAQIDAMGLGTKLMFSSDYPHWDFDPPDASVPLTLPRDVRRDILAGNAAKLYRIDLA